MSKAAFINYNFFLARIVPHTFEKKSLFMQKATFYHLLPALVIF